MKPLKRGGFLHRCRGSPIPELSGSPLQASERLDSGTEASPRIPVLKAHDCPAGAAFARNFASGNLAEPKKLRQIPELRISAQPSSFFLAERFRFGKKETA